MVAVQVEENAPALDRDAQASVYTMRPSCRLCPISHSRGRRFAGRMVLLYSSTLQRRPSPIYNSISIASIEPGHGLRTHNP